MEGAAIDFFEIRKRCACDLRRRARENFNSSARFSFCRRRIANHCLSGQRNYVARNGNHKSGGEILFENGKWENLKSFEKIKRGIKKNGKFGGADGVRTHDLLDAIEARSQLRHGPTPTRHFCETKTANRRQLSKFYHNSIVPSAQPHSVQRFSSFCAYSSSISPQFVLIHVQLSSSFPGVCRYGQPASGAICWPRPQNPPNCLRSRDHVSSSNFRKFSRRALPTLQQTGSRAEHGYEERNGIARSPRRQSNGISPDFSSFCAALPGLRKRICLQRKPDSGFLSGDGSSCKSRLTSIRLKQTRPRHVSNLR